MTPGKRIKKARVASGISQQLLANAISNYGDGKKVSRTAIAQWESGVTKEIEAANLLKAAKILNVTPEWLQFGIEDKRFLIISDKSEVLANDSKPVRAVPIFNFTQVANHITVDKSSVSYVGIDQELAAATGDKVFALVVEGSSMEPIFCHGDMVIIDPDIKPQPGEIVLASIKDEENITVLRKYRPLEKDHNSVDVFELIAFNEDWPKITVSPEKPGYIMGTLVEHRRRRRLQHLIDLVPPSFGEGVCEGS